MLFFMQSCFFLFFCTNIYIFYIKFISERVRTICLPSLSLSASSLVGRNSVIQGWGRLHSHGHTSKFDAQNPINKFKRVIIFEKIFLIAHVLFLGPPTLTGKGRCCHSRLNQNLLLSEKMLLNRFSWKCQACKKLFNDDHLGVKVVWEGDNLCTSSMPSKVEYEKKVYFLFIGWSFP